MITDRYHSVMWSTFWRGKHKGFISQCLIGFVAVMMLPLADFYQPLLVSLDLIARKWAKRIGCRPLHPILWVERHTQEKTQKTTLVSCVSGFRWIFGLVKCLMMVTYLMLCLIEGAIVSCVQKVDGQRAAKCTPRCKGVVFLPLLVYCCVT